jgi:hypothetical protein
MNSQLLPVKENGFALRDFLYDLVDRLLWTKIRSTKSHDAAHSGRNQNK